MFRLDLIWAVGVQEFAEVKFDDIAEMPWEHDALLGCLKHLQDFEDCNHRCDKRHQLPSGFAHRHEETEKHWEHGQELAGGAGESPCFN